VKQSHPFSWKSSALIALAAAGVLLSVARAADQNFSDAINNVLKAKAFVAAASSTAVNPANQAQVEALQRQAYSQLKAAEATLELAKVVQDAP
jgi:hypothetical protein